MASLMRKNFTTYFPVLSRTEAASSIFLPPDQFGSIRHAANLKQIKGRMTIVKNIGKITKTMKMVASARLRFAQKKMEESRPYTESAIKVAKSLPLSEEGQFKKDLALVITSDRGLCGSINSSCVKATRALFEKTKEKGSELMIASLGEKGTAQLSRFFPDNMILSCHETSKAPLTFSTVGLIIDEALNNQEFDKVSVIYNNFISMLASETTISTTNSYQNLLQQIEKGGASSLEPFEFEEDDKLTHLRDWNEFNLASEVYNAYLENQTSELGARMNSMDTASKNAGEMFKRLTIAYNRGRQAAITTELIEIISGAEAL